MRTAIKTLFQGAWKTVLIGYAILNIAGIPDNADDLRDYLLPLGAYPGRIVGIVVLVAVLLSLVPAKARAWLWTRRPWKQGVRPVADGDAGVSSPPPEFKAPTGVLADIEHRKGCPRDPARMETYKKVRERDGIEITTGKCNDCGAMAYRHSADPVVPPPVPSVLQPRASHEGKAPPIPDKPVRVALSDEAREVVAAELAKQGPLRHEPIDTVALAQTLRGHYSRGRPILTDAANAPDKSAIYKTNQSFTTWGEAIEKALTSQLLERMAAFVMSLERPDPPALFKLNVQALLGGGTGAVGPGGHPPLRTQVGERLDRLQALIEALESQP